MVSKTGLHIVRARQAFEQAGRQELIVSAENALQHGILGAGRLQDIKDLLEERAEGAPVKLWHDGYDSPNSFGGPKMRQIKSSMAYMDVPDPRHPGRFSPAVLNCFASRFSLIYFERRLPLILSTGHISDKVSLHTGKIPTFAEAPYIYLAGFSILFSEAMGEILDEHETNMIPTFMAHSEGMFFGYAKRVPPNSFNHHFHVAGNHRALIEELFKISRRSKKTKPISLENQKAEISRLNYLLNAIKDSEKWQAPTVITLRTFVGRNELNPLKGKVFDALSHIMDDPRMPEILRFAMEAYAMGSSERAAAVYDLMKKEGWKMRKAHKQYDELKDQVKGLVRSNDWIELEAGMDRHLDTIPFEPPPVAQEPEKRALEA